MTKPHSSNLTGTCLAVCVLLTTCEPSHWLLMGWLWKKKKALVLDVTWNPNLHQHAGKNPRPLQLAAFVLNQSDRKSLLTACTSVLVSVAGCFSWWFVSCVRITMNFCLQFLVNMSHKSSICEPSLCEYVESWFRLMFGLRSHILLILSVAFITHHLLLFVS